MILEPQLIARRRRDMQAQTTAVFAAALLTAAGLGLAGMTICNVARTYVAGEAQYSKAQKEAVIALMRYAQNGAARDWGLYQASLDVFEGDRAARQALEGTPVNSEAATAGFLRGRNSARDIPAMILGFRLLRHWSPFAEAAADWRDADRPFVDLARLGERIRRERNAGDARSSPDEASQIERADAALTAYEQRFSEKMGKVARSAIDLAYLMISGLCVVVGAAGAWGAWRIQKASSQIADRLLEAKVRADEANKSKGDFLANMSHEIRTPLTAIIGYADLMRQMDRLEPQPLHYAQSIASAGQSLMSLLNDILDFSKIEAGEFELNPEPIDPESFFAEILGLVSAPAHLKGLTLTIRRDGPMPARIMVDGVRLQQVVLNLLTNAIKFTSHGGVTLEVAYTGDELCVAVKDTGIGVPAEAIPHLFERFAQADASVSRRHGGAGLGLAISRRLVDMMGGRMSVSSVVDEGSTFRFTVRASPAAYQPALQPVADEPGPAHAATVLVVDDNAANREIIATLLRIGGHTVTVVQSGFEAVDAASRTAFDLILMDLQMPGMGGLEATKVIRSSTGPNAQTPIVALSADVLASHVDACRHAGMNDHIPKPINAAQLLRKIEEWTQARDVGVRASA